MRLKVTRKNLPLLATFAVFLMIYAAGAIAYPGFLSLRVFVNLLYDNAFIGIIAVGMTFVILSGGIDLSVGSFLGFTGVLAANLLSSYGVNPWMVILITLASGMLFGLIMGTLIVAFELPPFLVTLVGMFLARGLCYVISLDSVPIRDETFLAIAGLSIPLGGGVRLTVHSMVFIAVLVIGAYMLHFTRFGRTAYAIGGNEKSAVLMGLPVMRTKILIYTLNSTICAIGGLVYSLYTLSGYPRAGTMLELDVIASVVIGGTLLSGGVGFVEGTLVGVLILGLIQTIITFQGTLSTWWTKIFIGILISVFILLQTYMSRSSFDRRLGSGRKEGRQGPARQLP
mgnify:CR=1 FL=1